MAKILNMEELKKLSEIVIDIPNFDNTGFIKVKVQKPRLMSMAAQGKIPNHLLSVANEMINGNSSKKDKDNKLNITDIAKMMELYCQACLIQPSYKDFKEIMTDDQMTAVFDWGMGSVDELDSFRDDKEDGSDNDNGK